MTQMQMTSLLAYKDAKKDLNRKQKLVLEAVENIGPATNRQIGEYLGWPINSITPRVLELRQKNKLVSCFMADDNGRKAHWWGTHEQRTN
jgi:DNA-binding MarR family transcriptional regulator